jgi:hypothetical protein
MVNFQLSSFIFLKFSTKDSLLAGTIVGHNFVSNLVSKAQFPLVAINCLPFSDSMLIRSKSGNFSSKYWKRKCWTFSMLCLAMNTCFSVDVQNPGQTDRLRVDQVQRSRMALFHQQKQGGQTVGQDRDGHGHVEDLPVFRNRLYLLILKASKHACI